MKIKYQLIIVLSLILCASCNAQNNGSVAVLKTQQNISIEVKRVHIHAFLAEYDRFLTLKVDGKTAAELQIATDTGGYSRANIYSTDLPNVFVVEDLMGFYKVDVTKRQISKLDSYPCKNPEEYIFIGAFDTDDSELWQFISASKRKKLSIERGCVGEVK